MTTAYGIVFLKTDTRLTYEEREFLTAHAIDMRYTKEKTRDVEVEGRFEGRVYSTKKTASFGSFSGVVFKAEIDINNVEGKANLEFIVCHQGHIPRVPKNFRDN